MDVGNIDIEIILRNLLFIILKYVSPCWIPCACAKLHDIIV